MALQQVSDQNLDELHADLMALSPKNHGSSGNGDGPYDEGMRNRIIKLEDFADDAKQRLVRVEAKLDHIDKEVSNFKWWVVAQIFAVLLTVVGTGVAIQQMTVSTFQAAGAQAQPAPQPPIIINVPQAVTPAALPPASAPAPTN